MIDSGIVIDEPWIGLILNGQKQWEMRSKPTQVRGPIALIKKGSGTIVGTAELVSCIGPLDKGEISESIDKHAIPKRIVDSGRVDKWNYAWVLSNVKPLDEPIHYVHRKGAVVWVGLDTAVSQKLSALTDSTKELHTAGGSRRDNSGLSPERPPERVQVGRPTPKRSDQRAGQRADSYPVAKDGSIFGRHLGVRGYYQVGAKGEEEKYKNFEDALEKLREMKVARWRRPNKRGNWGIVSAVQWDRVD